MTTPVIISKIWNTFETVDFITWPIVASSSISYCLSVMFLWNEERHTIFQVFGCLLWGMIALYIIDLLWPPIWMMMMLGVLFYGLSKISSKLSGMSLFSDLIKITVFIHSFDYFYRKDIFHSSIKFI